MTAAGLLVAFLGGVSTQCLADRHEVPRQLVEDEIRWCFQLPPPKRDRKRWRRAGLEKVAARSSRRWPFNLNRLQRFVDTVGAHEPISAADQARRFGCSRRAAAMALAHLEDLGYVAWSWQVVPRAGARGATRRKLWRLA